MLSEPNAYADQLLSESVVTDGTLSLPVDLEKVAKPLGYEVFAREDLTPEQSPQIGVANDGSESVAIFVSAAEPHGEQTPKIASAMAALIVMPEDESKTIEQRLATPVDDDAVAWSHAFVGELLVPAGTVVEQWQNLREQMPSVQEAVQAFATAYAVSEAFMLDRLVTLGVLTRADDDAEADQEPDSA